MIQYNDIAVGSYFTIMNEWKIKHSKENSIALNRLAREEMKYRRRKMTKLTKNKRWKPKRGEKYYYITSSGILTSIVWRDIADDNFRYAQNNCYKTEEAAKEYLENLKTKGELRLLAEELNSGGVIDWQNFDQDKYYLFYDNDGEFSGEFLCGDANTFAQSQGVLYCLSGNFCEEAIKRIGKERLIKMIKSGV